MAKKYILRECSNPKIVYGILSIDTDVDRDTVQKAIYDAREKARVNDGWNICDDVLGYLPKEWKATLYDYHDIYI